LIYELFSPLYTGRLSVQTFGIDRHGGHLAMTFWSQRSAKLLAYTPEGLLVSITKAAMCTWDTQTGDETTYPVQLDESLLACYTLAQSGKTFASGSRLGDVDVWNVLAPLLPPRRLLGHRDCVVCVALSDDGDLVASASRDGTMRIWNTDNCQELAVIHVDPNRASPVAFSPDGQHLASGSANNVVQLWNGIPCTPVEMHVLDHNSAADCICFSRDSTKIAVGLSDATIVLWVALTRTNIATFRGHSRSISSVQFSPDGTSLVSASYDTTVRVWNTNQSTSDQPLAVLTGHDLQVYSATFSPDGRYIATASGDKTIQIWNASGIRQAGGAFQARQSYVNTVAVSADGAIVVSGSDDCSVRVWDAQAGVPKLPPLLGHTKPLTSVVISPDASLIASVSNDSAMRLWDARTGAAADELLGSPMGQVSATTFSFDGQWLACGSYDRNIYIWNIATGHLSNIGPIYCDGWAAVSVAFSVDNRIIAGGDRRGNVHLWDMNSGQQVYEPALPAENDAPYLPIIFSPTCTHMASEINKIVRIVDIATGQQVVVFTGHTSSISSIAYSFNGLVIAAGSMDGTVRLWAAKTGMQVAVLHGHTGTVSAVCFTWDGKFLISGSEDSTIRVWDIRAACLSWMDVDDNPAAAVETTGLRGGWLLGSQEQLLLWVPKDYRGHLQLPSCRTLISQHRVVITAEADWHLGNNWTDCWRGPVLVEMYPPNT